MNIRALVPFPRSGASLSADDPFIGLGRDMDRLFGDLWRGFGTGLPTAMAEAASLPRLDVKETEKAIVIAAELPGVDESDISVEVNERVLTIRGEKKQEKEESDKGYHLSERSYGSFMRSLQLPFAIDESKIEATYKKGVLSITVPKPIDAVKGTKKVQIKAA